jgi:hypothetical protein
MGNIIGRLYDRLEMADIHFPAITAEVMRAALLITTTHQSP